MDIKFNIMYIKGFIKFGLGVILLYTCYVGYKLATWDISNNFEPETRYQAKLINEKYEILLTYKLTGAVGLGKTATTLFYSKRGSKDKYEILSADSISEIKWIGADSLEVNIVSPIFSKLKNYENNDIFIKVNKK